MKRQTFSDVAVDKKVASSDPELELKNRLAELADVGYGKYLQKFLPPESIVLGIRVPQLREVARKIARTNGRELLNAVLFDVPRRGKGGTSKTCEIRSCEEKIAIGIVVAETETTFENRLDAIAAFVPQLDSWLVCDLFCSSLKIPKENRSEFWDFLDAFAESPRPYEVRFAVVATLTRYLETPYLDAVFERCNRIAARKLGEYYVDMSLAWLTANCFVKFPDATLRFLRDCEFDDAARDKALRKICESRRVDEETKNEIRLLKSSKRR